MKILFVSSWYPSENNPNKGLFVKKHAAAIKQAGNDIRVLAVTVNPSKSTFFEKKKFSFVDEHGIQTDIIEINSKYYKWIHVNIFFQYRVLKACYKSKIKDAFNADIIHSNVIYPNGIMGYWLAKSEKKKSVITEHWTRLHKFFRKSLYASPGKKAYKNSEITVVSEFLKNTIKQYGISEKQIHIIPNVIEPYFFSGVNEHTKDLVFICCANWTSHKRPDIIFETLERITKRINQKITLNVVGIGPHLDKVNNRKWSFEVNYFGFKSAPEIASIMRSSKYFIHASDDETFSVVIAEALSNGLPVVASGVGAVPELIKDHNGILCNNTPEDWENGVMELINKSYDHGRISKEMEKFLAPNIGKKFSELYKDIIR